MICYWKKSTFDIHLTTKYHIAMRKIKNIMNKNKNFIALLLVASFLLTLPYAAELVWATSAQDKKEEAEESLKDVENEIDDIENQQQQVQSELDTVRAKLSKLMDQQEALEAEISTTQDDIEQTTKELEEARIAEQEQYEAMKLRIRFMYENSTKDDFWTAIIEAKGIADMLNRVEYVSTIYESDRELTEQYQATVAKVEEKEQHLLTTLDDLLVKQETFLGQQAEIESMIADLEDTQSEYATQLVAAQEQAATYQKTIKEQEKIIKEQKEAAKKAAEQAAQQNASNGQNVTGQQLVNYALQFVGNPYVWGGNSLTNGCDCSGFVHLVYKHFGYNTVRYSMSFLYEGVAVDIKDIQVGDVVVYEKKNGIGHVAIYIGNGKIVEAQSTAAGITSNRDIDCRPIAGIRRILGN